MEEVVQRVFAVIVAVLIFFILPLYIAFEKKDDISYSLALKVTTNFVNNVTTKGYLTNDMYDDFISQLSVTDNVYDIELEYIAKKYNPIVQVVDTNDGDNKGKIVAEYDYLEIKEEYDKYVEHNVRDLIKNSGVANSNTKGEVRLTYKLSEERYATTQIFDILDSTDNYISSENYKSYNSSGVGNLPTLPRIYGLRDEGFLAMNEGDEFNVIIKNKNTTIASVLFNTLTFGANTGNDTKVYINYGGTVHNQEYMPPKVVGDINGDGKVDTKDAELMNNPYSLTLKQKIAADTNRDGVVDSLAGGTK